MFQTLVLARPFGVELRAHGSLLFVMLVGALVSVASGGLAGLLSTALLLAALIASVSLHELGHVLAARSFGTGTQGITLYPFGGLAELDRDARTPREEISVALAGPAVNLALAGLAALPLALGVELAFVQTFLVMNLALALFNLLPAYPMDGGRVLRGLLWRRIGRFEGTWWAARAGQGFAGLFALGGIVGGQFMLVVIAAFVFMQASAELWRLRLQQAGGGLGDLLAQILGQAPAQGQQRAEPMPQARPRRNSDLEPTSPSPFRRVRFVVREGQLEPVDTSPW